MINSCIVAPFDCITQRLVEQEKCNTEIKC
ncbi:MAG: hypothetical protein K0S47_4132 [Herbinix sp.]|jgi:hypothetical protein|nr:hypothetical protein [Herbinix sp.]